MTLAVEEYPSMEPPSKRIRDVTFTDRLSDLPDCIIHYILTFLESRQVVRSSVLSRRWRHLWRSVSCLDIDQTVFPGGDDRCKDRKCCGKRPCKKEWQPFEEFGNNLSLLNDARSLDKLRIHVPVLCSNDTQAIGACSRWIRTGVKRSPAVVDIHQQFPWSFRTSWFLPDVGSSRLTTLLLHGVNVDDSFAEQLRSGCPVLEELSLVGCSYYFGEIFSTSLRHLTVDGCFVREGMVVTAPKLTSLRTTLSSVCCPKGIYATDTSSFVKAAVCVNIFTEMDASFRERLCNIFNVMHLELFGSYTMDGIRLIANKLPKFQNVRTLLINKCNLETDANIQALDRFQQSTPGLEKLTLQNCEFSGHSKRAAKWRHVPLESQNLISFKCGNLEVIEIKHSKDDNIDEFFKVLMALWRNLGKTNIKLIKV